MIKRIIIVLCIIITMLCGVPNKLIYGQCQNVTDKRILVLASYTMDNPWEKEVIEGISQSLDNSNILKIEFLDSRMANSKLYDESLLNLLNVKYDNNIDYIVTIDDEAFNFARKNLFNKDSFMYKKPIIFCGVNSYVTLSAEESEYVTGILEYQNNIEMLNVILNENDKLNEIYLLIDNSIYCSTVKENIEASSEHTDKEFKLNIVEETYLQDLLNNLSICNDKNSAIYLCGVYKDKESDETINPEVLISEIKKVTKAPIYTKLKEYIEAGAVGGVVNDGYKLGNAEANIIDSLENLQFVYKLNVSFNNFNSKIFNYKAIEYYNINPLKLPGNSIYINKGPFDLLLPKYMKKIINVLTIASILMVALLIYFLIVNRRKIKHNRRLLNESMERENIRTDFILTISHELRTPLNIIMNAANLLKMKVDANEFNEEFFYEKIKYILKGSYRLRRYINNLIDVSRMEIGNLETKFTNENIVSVVEEVTLSIVDLAKSYNISVTFDTEEEEIITAIDKIKIERVILNLLSNSIKFTKDLGSIFVNVKRSDRFVIIEVEDNGIGIDKELQKFIFEKFKRADSSEGLKRSYEGSGLGLYLVKGLINLHNGEITVESEEGKGSIFTIKLPIKIIDIEENINLIKNDSIEFYIERELSDLDK